MIRTAIVGTGTSARLHAAAARDAGLSVTAVGGRDREAMHRVGESAGTDVEFMTVDAAVRAGNIDAVVIAVPASVQPALAVAAFEAGKHVLCEKPLAASLADAERIRDAWRAAGTVGMVNFCYRHIPAIAEFRTRLDAGECGALSWIGVEWVLPSRLDSSLPFSWKADASAGGGALHNFASHVFDYLLHGRTARVASAWQHTLTPARVDRAGTLRATTADEALTVTLDVDGWCPVVVHVSLVTQAQAGHRMVARGSKGTLTAWNTSVSSPAGPFACAFSAGVMPDARPCRDGARPDEDLRGLFTRMARRFAGAIGTGGDASPDIDAGVAGARLAAAVAAAARARD